MNSKTDAQGPQQFRQGCRLPARVKGVHRQPKLMASGCHGWPKLRYLIFRQPCLVNRSMQDPRHVFYSNANLSFQYGQIYRESLEGYVRPCIYG